MRRLASLVSTCLLAAFGGGCSAHGDPEYDAKVPGTPLGTFSVTGRLEEDACGADLLGVADPWRFEVKLSRLAEDLYWLNGREALVGELDSKRGTFEFAVRVDVPLSSFEERSRDKRSCIISRYDRAGGTFDTKDVLEAEGFVGFLDFEYRVKPGTECFELIGVPGGFYDLPCNLRYALSAERRASP